MVSIRGMDMPDSCSECRFCIDSEDGYYESWCAAMTGDDRTLGGGTVGEEAGRHVPRRYRQPGCPLEAL